MKYTKKNHKNNGQSINQIYFYFVQSNNFSRFGEVLPNCCKTSN